MSDTHNYTPTPINAKHVEQLYWLANLIGEQELDYPWFKLITVRADTRHAMYGVRVNGHNQKISIVDVHRSFSELRDALSNTMLRVNRSLKYIEGAQYIWDSNYEFCPVCKGEKGAFIENIPLHKYWKDCTGCDGEGAVTRNDGKEE